MPRDGSGTFSVPPGTEGAPNTVISSAAYDTFLSDLTNVLNTAAPTLAGGTGGNSAITGWDGLATKGTDIASASSVNLQTATGPSLTITGTASISTVTLNEGKVRVVRAGGAFTLTASANLLVNGSASTNLTVAAEDLLLFRGGAGSVVSVARLGSVSLTFASTTEVLTGTNTTKPVNPDALAALWEKGSNVASAGTTALGEGGFFHITGTTGITDIDFSVATDGRRAWVVFDGILTLTHNATTLQLPGGANITTAAGDRALFVQDASDNIICLDYVRASGGPLVTLTANNVLLGNGTGVPQVVAPSTSGNVLTSNGTTWTSAAPAAGGQPIPTSSTLAIGSFAFCRYGSTTAVTSGSTASGSNLALAIANVGADGLASGGAAQTGTWRNDSGVTQDSDGSFRWGYWTRTA